jgi:hypothetical protein
MGNFEKFMSHLDASFDPVWFVARWLWNEGYTVTIPLVRKAPSHSEWRKYVDNGDILIPTSDGNFLRIEVKQSSRYFSSLDDWPFPEFFVCAKHSYDIAIPKPAFYLILSSDKKVMAVVNVEKTVSKWTVTRKQDRRYDNVIQPFYICPLDLITWKIL